MKRIILVYGLISGGIVIALITLSMIFSDPLSTHVANLELLGYLVMVLALSLVFVGVKRYRDEELGGVISFWDALKVGVGIALVAGAVYVAGWETYLGVSGNDFMDAYAQSYIEQLQEEGASAQELQEAGETMEYYKQMYANPLSRMGITFLEIFPVGLLISLISAFLLRRSDFLPAT